MEKNTRKELAYKTLIHVLLTAGAAVILLPFVWMVSTSLKDSVSAYTYPPRFIPSPVKFENYSIALQSFPFLRYLWNTFYIALLITVGVVFTSSLAGYAFARINFKGRDKVFLLVLAVMMVPGQVTMIPVFILVKSFGWMDSHAALIIPSLATSFGIFLMRQFFLTLPVELEEAACLDGCGPFRTYLSIFLPLCKPAVTALSIFTFIGAWKTFFWPLVLITSSKKQVLTVGLLAFTNTKSEIYNDKYNLIMAASVVSILPILIVYLFAQKYFIEGIALTGIKG